MLLGQYLIWQKIPQKQMTPRGWDRGELEEMLVLRPLWTRGAHSEGVKMQSIPIKNASKNSPKLE